MIYKFVVVFSVMAAAGAQMLLKKGAQSPPKTSLISQYLNRWVISGYLVLGLSLFINIYCLSQGVQVKEISIIESLSYLFVPLFSWFFFRETINWKKVGSICIIIVGIIIFFI